MAPPTQPRSARAKWLVFVGAIILIGGVMAWLTTSTRPTPVTVTVANASSHEIIAQYMQSQENTWHTPIAGERITIAPGGEWSFEAARGDRIAMRRATEPDFLVSKAHEVKGSQRLEIREESIVVTDVE